MIPSLEAGGIELREPATSFPAIFPVNPCRVKDAVLVAGFNTPSTRGGERPGT
jgi:hypothetical protein